MAEYIVAIDVARVRFPADANASTVIYLSSPAVTNTEGNMNSPLLHKTARGPTRLLRENRALKCLASPAMYVFPSHVKLQQSKSPLWGSSPRPYAYEAHALPAELRRHDVGFIGERWMIWIIVCPVLCMCLMSVGASPRLADFDSVAKWT